MQPVNLGPLSVVMAAHNTTYTAGGFIRLLCIVTGRGNIVTSWTKDGAALTLDDRVTTNAEGELTLDEVVPADSGMYRCTATRGAQSVHVEAQIQVTGQSALAQLVR